MPTGNSWRDAARLRETLWAVLRTEQCREHFLQQRLRPEAEALSADATLGAPGNADYPRSFPEQRFLIKASPGLGRDEHRVQVGPSSSCGG
jgi:hypothetical protein